MTELVLGQTAVYRLYDKAARLLYVGIGSSPEARWADHAKQKHWWPQVSRKSVQWYPTREEALAIEAQAISSEKPLHNAAVPRIRAVVSHAPEGPRQVPLKVVRERFGDLVTAAQYGQTTIITRNGRPAAMLVPYAPQESVLYTHTFEISDDGEIWMAAGDDATSTVEFAGDPQRLAEQVLAEVDDPHGHGRVLVWKGGQPAAVELSVAVALRAPQEISFSDLRGQVVQFLEAGDHGDDYDVDGIVEAIRDQHGLVDLDSIDAEDFNGILAANDMTA